MSSSSPSTTTRSTSPSSSGTSTSRWQTSPLSGSLPSRELAAQHVTVALSGQGADELFGGYAKHSAASLVGRWQRLPGAMRAPRRGALGAAGRRGSRARPRARSAADPVERLLAVERPAGRRRCARGSSAARSPARRRRGARVRSRAAGRRRRRPLRTTLYLDAQLGAGRRHAALLRPHVDGALARGARAVPRPPRRRVLRDDPDRVEGAAA